MAGTQSVGDLTCECCQKPGWYSLTCLPCVRRLWKNTLPETRPAILEMVEAYGSKDIARRIKAATKND